MSDFIKTDRPSFYRVFIGSPQTGVASPTHTHTQFVHFSEPAHNTHKANPQKHNLYPHNSNKNKKRSHHASDSRRVSPGGKIVGVKSRLLTLNKAMYATSGIVLPHYSQAHIRPSAPLRLIYLSALHPSSHLVRRLAKRIVSAAPWPIQYVCVCVCWIVVQTQSISREHIHYPLPEIKGIKLITEKPRKPTNMGLLLWTYSEQRKQASRVNCLWIAHHFPLPLLLHITSFGGHNRDMDEEPPTSRHHQGSIADVKRLADEVERWLHSNQ